MVANGHRAKLQRVLLVEPYADAQEMLALLLECLGYSVQRTDNVRGALSALADNHPNIVLTELALEGQSGLNFCRSLRQLPSMESARIVALTSYCSIAEKAELLVSGFDGVLLKPVELVHLLDMLSYPAELRPGLN